MGRLAKGPPEQLSAGRVVTGRAGPGRADLVRTETGRIWSYRAEGVLGPVRPVDDLHVDVMLAWREEKEQEECDRE